MHRLLGVALIMVGGLSTGAFASNLPQAFNAQDWQALVDQASNKGQVMPFGDGMELHYLAKFDPADTQGPHNAAYFSVVGVRDSDGVFHPLNISLVDENWQITDGNWWIDQWIFQGDLDGSLVKTGHSRIVETPKNIVLETKDFPTQPVTDSRSLDLWGLELSRWHKTDDSRARRDRASFSLP